MCNKPTDKIGRHLFTVDQSVIDQSVKSDEVDYGHA